MSARTEPEIFDDFRQQHPADGLRWREWWRRYWMDHIRDYFELGWKLLPCGKYSKRPLAGFKWSERDLGYEEAVWYAAQGMNLAVKAGPSGLAILDIDSLSRKPFDTSTLTMKTPRGYQYFTQAPKQDPDERTLMKLQSAHFDMIRANVMYSLIPLSTTCLYDRGGSCSCLVHDFRVREWVNFGASPQPFNSVVKEIFPP